MQPYFYAEDTIGRLLYTGLCLYYVAVLHISLIIYIPNKNLPYQICIQQANHQLSSHNQQVNRFFFSYLQQSDFTWNTSYARLA